MARGYAVGIDLGTTNSVVAHGTVASAAVLPDERGHRTVPSVVSFTPDGAVVGREAHNRAVQHPVATVRSIKREMGRETTVETPHGSYAPEQVSALVLERLKRQAEAALDAPVDRAVITVPAYFGHHQRAATRRAGEIAGFRVDRIINEPTAACLAYGVGTAASGPAETVLVYDLGGGTFDVSLVEISDGIFDVVATSGDTRLGGDDWDERVAAWLRERAAEETGREVGADPATAERLRQAAKRARHKLTDHRTTTVALPFVADERTVEVELTRERLDDLTGDLVDRTVDICDTLVREVDWNAWTIDEVLLVGGMTRMPQVRRAVHDFFGQVPSKDVNPDEVVATGAAVQAGVLNERPQARTATAGAGGEATDGGPVLVDVVPQSLGVETAVDGEDGYFSPVVERNTSIPTRRTAQFCTVRDNQTTVKVRVYQGESDRVADNEFLGAFELTGVPPAPAGEVRVSVTFAVDENGVLSVEAAEEATGTAADITIESALNRADREVERMRDELPTVDA